MRNRSFLQRLKPVAIGSAMADMALLLLIFFMASTTSDPPKIGEVELPQADTQDTERDTLHITVTKNGKLYFDQNPVSLEQLKSSLAMRHYDKEKVIAISADKGLDYREVARVLTILQEEDFLNVVFMSQPSEKDKTDDQANTKL